MTDWIKETLYSNGVLRNKLGIKDQQRLADREYLLTATRELIILQQKPVINDISLLNEIHQFMFSPLYTWAGKYRSGDFSKSNTHFLEHTRFNFAKQDINNIINRLNNKNSLQDKEYALLLDRLNYMHPFREGNGKSIRTFLQCFAANHQQVIDYPRNNQQMIKAQHNSDIEGIAALISLQNTPTREMAFLELMLRYRDTKH